jgi:hypothetical protein
MPIECPRCLLNNPDSSCTCECGFDLTSMFQKQTPVPGKPFSRKEHAVQEAGMSKEGFALGTVVIWTLLTFGEWLRMKAELSIRKPLSLIADSILLSLTDMVGALTIGALGWMVVWIILSYEGRRFRPCPKRTTLGVTVVSAGLLFLSRWIAPGIQTQHVVLGVVILAVAVFAYYAGSRQWLGRW